MSGRSLNSNGVRGYELQEKMTSDMFIDATLLASCHFCGQNKTSKRKINKLKKGKSKSLQGFLSIPNTENQIDIFNMIKVYWRLKQKQIFM